MHVTHQYYIHTEKKSETKPKHKQKFNAYYSKKKSKSVENFNYLLKKLHK